MFGERWGHGTGSEIARTRGSPGSTRNARALGWFVAAWLAAGCASGAPWEERLREERASDPGVEREVLPFGLWLPVEARGGRVAELRVAYELSLAGDVEGALSLLSQVAAEQPDDPAPLAARAALLRWIGFPRAAEYELSRALSMAPENTDYALGLARLRLQLGFRTAAIEALGRAQAAGRDDSEMHRLFGRAYARIGNEAEARAHYARAIERAIPCSSELLLEAAAMPLFASGPERLAEDELAWSMPWLERVREREPLRGRSYLLEGVLCERTGDRLRALAANEQASRLEPWNRVAWTQVALNARGLEDHERMLGAVEHALALEDDPGRHEWLEGMAAGARSTAVARNR